MNSKKVNTKHIIAIILFVVTLVVNYLSAFGVAFPHSQQEISDMHVDLLAPAGFTFSIWGVIYIGVILSLILPWISDISDEYKAFYYDKVMPLFILWMIFNIIWTFTWAYNKIAIALIAIIIYTLSLIKLTSTINKRPDLTYQNPWLLLWPIGLHTGWLTFASFTNIMTLLVKNGFDALATGGVVITILLMVLACIAVLSVYKKNDNAAITVPALWALFGIFMKQRPGSDFKYANTAVMIAAIVLFVLSLIAHFMILKEHRKNRIYQ